MCDNKNSQPYSVTYFAVSKPTSTWEFSVAAAAEAIRRKFSLRLTPGYHKQRVFLSSRHELSTFGGSGGDWVADSLNVQMSERCSRKEAAASVISQVSTTADARAANAFPGNTLPTKQQNSNSWARWRAAFLLSAQQNLRSSLSRARVRASWAIRRSAGYPAQRSMLLILR